MIAPVSEMDERERRTLLGKQMFVLHTKSPAQNDSTFLRGGKLSRLIEKMH